MQVPPKSAKSLAYYYLFYGFLKNISFFTRLSVIFIFFWSPYKETQHEKCVEHIEFSTKTITKPP